MRLFITLFLVIGTFSTLAQAQRAGITLGLSQLEAEAQSGVDVSSDGSTYVGALFYQPMTEQLEVRLGAFWAQQTWNLKKDNAETTLRLSKINVPLTAGFRFGERFLLFAGPVLSLNGETSCDISSGAKCNDSDMKVRGTDVLLSLGANFQLMSELGMEISYDRMSGKPFEGATGGHMINFSVQYVIE